MMNYRTYEFETEDAPYGFTFNNMNFDIDLNYTKEMERYGVLNSYSEEFLVDFVEEIISETRIGDIDWLVTHNMKNNRHLKICTSGDERIKITGVYDKDMLEKVSFNINKAISITHDNSRLLNRLKELITIAESKHNIKMDLPVEMIDYIEGFYERSNKIQNKKTFKQKLAKAENSKTELKTDKAESNVENKEIKEKESE